MQGQVRNLVLHQEYVLKSDSLKDYCQSNENCNGFYYEMSYEDYSIFIYEKKLSQRHLLANVIIKIKQLW